MQFHERLKSLRLSSGFMQKELAETVGVSIRAFQRYEHGDTEPNIETLIRIADVFDVSLDYLVGRSDSLNLR